MGFMAGTYGGGKGRPLLIGLFSDRRLVLELARNDLKKKFAGSYFGVVWAFVQPMITILLYWFIFEYGLNQKAADARTGIEIPFVLWLMAGLVPWFYFQEAVTGGTGVLVEYSYLVKKVVFGIDMLPFVKLVSALFSHLFFVAFAVVVFFAMGYPPDAYVLQVFYYTLCMAALSMGIAYATSAVDVFFRDMKEVVSIALQVGMWVTPIMWNFESMAQIPEWARIILRANPMYYVVSGYRDALIYKEWFWERPAETAYFWAFAVLACLAGTAVFRRLRPHFADVL